MSSTVDEVDGNYNITSDLEEKDSDTKCSEEEVLVNGDGCVGHENLNGDAHDEQEGSLINKAANLSSPLNGIKRDSDQEIKFILAEYEHTKSELSKKDSDTKCSEEEVLVNGDGCVGHENLNGDAHDEQEGSLINKAANLSSPLNGIKRDSDQEIKFILAEYEHTKSELSKLQTDYKLSVEREKSLCEKLQEEDKSVNELSRVNENLKTYLDSVLEDLKSAKEELTRYVI